MKRSRLVVALAALLAIALPVMAGCSPPAGNGSSGGQAGQRVVLENFAFRPANLEVKVGSAVTWENRDSAPHTVTADDLSFDSKNLDQGKTFSFTFTKAGTYDYHCSIHPSMVGRVVVK